MVNSENEGSENLSSDAVNYLKSLSREEVKEILLASYMLDHIKYTKPSEERQVKEDAMEEKKPDEHDVPDEGEAIERGINNMRKRTEREHEELDGSDEDEDKEIPQKKKRPRTKRDEEIEEHDDSGYEEEEKKKKKKKNVKRTRRNKMRPRREHDDSEETLNLIRQNIPPRNLPDIVADVAAAGQCSKPFWKQLTKSDVDPAQARLTLGKDFVKHELIPRLEESERPNLNGTDVSVFGQDGKAYQMKLKLWAKEKEVPVLTSGWKEFYSAYGFHECCDFVTVWMFRHRETHKICFAVIPQRFPLHNPLSSRIVQMMTKVFD